MSLARFLVKRLAMFIPTLWAVATCTFLFLRLIPGGPFDEERKLPPEIQANLAHRYGLDQPIGVQYVQFLSNLCRGDPGPSLKYIGRNTRDILVETFPVSLDLGWRAFVLALAVGFPLGAFAAFRKNSHADHLEVFLSTLGVAIPNFVFAVLLIWLFCHVLKILPPALWEGWRYTILPTAVLSLTPIAMIARVTRVSFEETLNQEFILTARAKGVSERAILWKHAFWNSLSAVLSILGPLAAMLLTGSFIVEHIFAIPGMGRHFVTAVTNRDYPLVIGVALVDATLILMANLVVDIAYQALDPRQRSA